MRSGNSQRGAQSMIPKSGNRFSEKIMLHQSSVRRLDSPGNRAPGLGLSPRFWA
jgi:hypothetical protein